MRRQSLGTHKPKCTVRLDRLQLTFKQDPTLELMQAPPFQSQKAHFIRPKPGGTPPAYRRAHWFGHKKSKMKFVVESVPRQPWSTPFRLTLFSDDRTGLVPSEVFSILELLPTFKLVLVELAFDFRGGIIGRRFVRAHALFGKARPRPTVVGTDYWGSRRVGKLIRCYQKDFDDDAP